MRNVVENVIAIRPVDARQADVPVIDAQIKPLADQALGQLHHRALAQIIRSCLEAEAEHADLLAASFDHGPHPALDLQLVARQDRREDGKRNVERFRLVQQRAQILGQARAAERKAGLQVIRREIELGVLAKDIHHAMAVHLEPLADIADLVGETHLERMPCVVRVLDHLGGLDVGPDERRCDPGVKTCRQIPACPVELADDGLRRIEEIVHGGSLAQELRVDADPEFGAGAPARARFERRDDHIAHGSGQHGAANRHDRSALMVAQGRADLLAYAAHVFQLDVAVAAAGRSHADQKQIGPLDRDGGIRRRAQPAGGHLLFYDPADVLFDDGSLAGVDQINLRLL